MRNTGDWRPSKYVMECGRLLPSPDARELAPSSRLVAALLTERYQPALARHARGRLLDLGCGKVPLYEAYRDRVEAITCVDWPGSPHGARHVDVACDLAAALPLPDASFETVVSSDVLEHLPDPELALAEIGRVLAPGGTLLLNTPFLYGLHEEPHDYLRHTRHSLLRLLRRARLEPLALEEIGGIAEVLGDLLGKAAAELPHGARVASALQRAALAACRTRWGARLRQRTASRFPLGYFLVAQRPA